jgi:hypothetical protein
VCGIGKKERECGPEKREQHRGLERERRLGAGCWRSLLCCFVLFSLTSCRSFVGRSVVAGGVVRGGNCRRAAVVVVLEEGEE